MSQAKGTLTLVTLLSKIFLSVVAAFLACADAFSWKIVCGMLLVFLTMGSLQITAQAQQVGRPPFTFDQLDIDLQPKYFPSPEPVVPEPERAVPPLWGDEQSRPVGGSPLRLGDIPTPSDVPEITSVPSLGQLRRMR